MVVMEGGGGHVMGQILSFIMNILIHGYAPIYLFVH